MEARPASGGNGSSWVNNTTPCALLREECEAWGAPNKPVPCT